MNLARSTQADSLLKPCGCRTPMQLRKEVLGPEIPMFVAEWICGSIHACRPQDLMGELMDRRASDATADRAYERLAACRAVRVGERAEGNDIEVDGAVTANSAEGARLSRGREGPPVFRLRDHPYAKGRCRRAGELQPRVLERDLELAAGI